MTVNTRNRFVPGLASLVLFVVMAAAFLNANFGDPAGFPDDELLVHNLGYALFNIDVGAIPSEGFLAAFLITALALDVAIDAAIFLAKREEEGAIVSAIGGGYSDSDGESTIGGES